jgi:hypothetical protein
MVKSWSTLLAVSGRAGSRIEPALGCSAAASRRLAPWNLNRFGVWTYVATSLNAAA